MLKRKRKQMRRMTIVLKDPPFYIMYLNPNLYHVNQVVVLILTLLFDHSEESIDLSKGTSDVPLDESIHA